MIALLAAVAEETDLIRETLKDFGDQNSFFGNGREKGNHRVGGWGLGAGGWNF